MREKAMLKRNCLLVSLLLISLLALGPLAVQAAPVGTFVKVEGEVDLLKGGKVPATVVKAQDGLAVGDAVRTKSQSRAQIRFVDDTVLTIAPDSRVTIEEYMFNAAKGDRKAVLDVARGLVHTAVEKVYPKAEPDFIMKTHTAVLGVRGTRWYTKLLPTGTGVYTEGTKLEVRNLNPQFPAVRLMGTLQYCWVGWFMNATVPVNITRQDLKPLERQMTTGIGSGLTDMGPSQFTGGAVPPLAPQTFGRRAQVETLGSGLYVPPQISQPPPPPPPTYVPPPPPPVHSPNTGGSTINTGIESTTGGRFNTGS
jgi:hypothetical protein